VDRRYRTAQSHKQVGEKGKGGIRISSDEGRREQKNKRSHRQGGGTGRENRGDKKLEKNWPRANLCLLRDKGGEKGQNTHNLFTQSDRQRRSEGKGVYPHF